MDLGDLSAAPVVTSRRYGYGTTMAMATGLLVLDGLLTGQGILSVFTVIVGVPVLLLRALVTLQNPALRRRRLASVAVYLVAAITTIALVSADMRQAHNRAQRIIAACERAEAPF
jgi:hypothetical protein